MAKLLVSCACFLDFKERCRPVTGIPIAGRNVHADSMTSLTNLTTGCSRTSTKNYSWYMQVVSSNRLIVVMMHHNVNLIGCCAFLPVYLEIPAGMSASGDFTNVAGVQQTKSSVLLLLNEWQTSQLSTVQLIEWIMPCLLLVSQLIPKTSMRTYLIHIWRKAINIFFIIGKVAVIAVTWNWNCSATLSCSGLSTNEVLYSSKTCTIQQSTYNDPSDGLNILFGPVWSTYHRSWRCAKTYHSSDQRISCII